MLGRSQLQLLFEDLCCCGLRDDSFKQLQHKKIEITSKMNSHL